MREEIDLAHDAVDNEHHDVAYLVDISGPTSEGCPKAHVLVN